MNEFDYGGVTYRVDRLNTFEQAHIMRKISPLIPAALPVVLESLKAKERGDGLGQSLDSLSKLLAPLTSELASLADADCEYIMRTCMKVVKRKIDDKTYIATWVDGASRTVDDSINNLFTILKFCSKVIEVNLGPFFKEALIALQGLKVSPPEA